MYENKCAICGQPILGYWYEVGKKNVCQSCAATTTVYDLFQRDIIDIKPDIVDGEATLVTKDDEVDKAYMAEKSQLNAVYGMVVKDIVDSEATLVTKENEELSDELRSGNSDDATGEQVEKFFSSQEPAFNN